MIGDFLFQVRGLVSFEAEHGVPARRTPFGFLMPDYQQDNEGMDLWEKQFGEKAKGTTRLVIAPESPQLTRSNRLTRCASRLAGQRW